MRRAPSLDARRGTCVEPRRWTHLPVGTNVAGASYLYTSGKVLLDPVLEFEDVTVESHTAIASYVRTFGLLGTTGRFDFVGSPPLSGADCLRTG